MKKIGGWTRLLIVISGVLFVVGAYDMNAARDRARSAADEKYKSAFEPLPAECTDGSEISERLRKIICAAPPTRSDALLRRDAEIAAANDKSLNTFLAVWLYPTAFIGAVFFAVGWIRRGFQQRRQ